MNAAETILAGFTGVVLSVDRTGVIRATNGTLDKLVGRSVENVPVVEILDNTSAAKWQRILRADDADTLPCIRELVFTTPTSLELKRLLVTAGPAGSDSIYLIEQAGDAHFGEIHEEIHELNRELMSAQRDLARERARLARALADAQNALRMRDEVIAVVSHDLRNPLNTIMMGVELLKMELPEETKASQRDIIGRAAETMNRFINDLLEASALEAGGVSLDASPLRPASLVGEVKRAFDVQAAQRGQTLECTGDDDLPEIMADRHRLLQAISNLVSNALKFTPDRGTIRIGAQRDGDAIVFSVEDTGPGISAEDRDHIFDRFWRAPHERKGGTGLGLAIVKGIANAHHGSVAVQSDSGRGSRFELRIPAV